MPMSKAKRKKAAEKAAATRKRNAAKRRAAGKKAAATRKRNAGRKVSSKKGKSRSGGAKKVAKKTGRKGGKKGKSRSGSKKVPTGVMYCKKCPRVIFGGQKGLDTHNRRNHKGGK